MSTSDTQLCTVCFGDSKLLSETYLKEKDLNYFNFLKTFNLTGVCYDCFYESFELYNDDINDFFDWLDENDNRPDDTDETAIEKMRKTFNLTEQLLIKDPDKYIDNMSKYVLYLENMIESDVKDADLHQT